MGIFLFERSEIYEHFSTFRRWMVLIINLLVLVMVPNVNLERKRRKRERGKPHKKSHGHFLIFYGWLLL